MKRVVLIVLLSLHFLLIQPYRSHGDEAFNADQAQCYSNCLERLISRCSGKMELRNSTLIHVRQAAALYWFKARFFHDFKDELTREMLAQNVGTREYQIEHYVNQRFFEMLRMAVAGAPGFPERDRNP